jgi:sigma-B regulation protein RsbQ
MPPKVNAPSPRIRNNAKVSGNRSGQPIMFAHGYGCDQNMWRFVAPAFEPHYEVVLFDNVGAGNSDLAAFNPQKYATLQGYADDVIELAHDLKLKDIIFVGHSVSATIGILAAIREPELFDKLILIGPSPRYIDDDGYHGGFSKADIDGLLEFLDSNHLGWSATMAPVIMGNPDRPELSDELANSFCRTNPEIAKHFARVTFLSDNRDDYKRLTHRALILQCSQDSIAPLAVGKYVNETLANSAFVQLKATGHCPHLSAPPEIIVAIREFLSASAPQGAAGA